MAFPLLLDLVSNYICVYLFCYILINTYLFIYIIVIGGVLSGNIKLHAYSGDFNKAI
jgi:hypothetical protein